MTHLPRPIWGAIGICVLAMALVIVLGMTLGSRTGIKVAIFNEGKSPIHVELWKHKEQVLLQTLEGNQSATCAIIPPGEPLVVRVHDSMGKKFEKELDIYYETSYTGAIRVFFQNGEISYESELEMPVLGLDHRQSPADEPDQAGKNRCRFIISAPK